MMLTSKQRSFLKGLANNLDVIVQVGKASVSPDLTDNVLMALEKHELVKIGVLQNCGDTPKDIAAVLSERTGSQIVQVIGKKIVLYKAAKKPKIELPR